MLTRSSMKASPSGEIAWAASRTSQPVSDARRTAHRELCQWFESLVLSQGMVDQRASCCNWRDVVGALMSPEGVMWLALAEDALRFKVGWSRRRGGRLHGASTRRPYANSRLAADKRRSFRATPRVLRRATPSDRISGSVHRYGDLARSEVEAIHARRGMRQTVHCLLGRPFTHGVAIFIFDLWRLSVSRTKKPCGLKTLIRLPHSSPIHGLGLLKLAWRRDPGLFTSSTITQHLHGGG